MADKVIIPVSGPGIVSVEFTPGGTVPPDPPVPVEGPYDYFHKWASHPTAIPDCTRSLRSQDQLDMALTSSFRPSKWFTYDYENDPSPRKQDAARLMLRVGQSKPPVGNRPKWYPNVATGSLIFITDTFPDETWGAGMLSGSDMTGNKAWRYYLRGDHAWWANMWGYRDSYNGGIVLTDEFSTGQLPNGMTHKEGVAPCGEGTPYTQYPRSGTHYAMPPNMWHRTITRIEYLRPPEDFTSWNRAYNVTVQPNPVHDRGCWHKLSKWIIREGEATPTRLLYEVPMAWPAPNGIIKPDFETTILYAMLQFDTSQNGADCPERWCYHRGLITLHNYDLPLRPEDNTELFKAPVR